MSDKGDRDEPTQGGDAARDPPGHVSEPVPEHVYVNHCSVTLTLSMAELDFGQASEADQSVRIKSRLRTSPTYFRQLGDLIRAECRRYDDTYGVRRPQEGN